ncbi:L-2-amino-thiazoline-4-carboxylic acid hydrolase [Clostridium estertheticum]|uniref:L-2-amino-thiazoline-4-carboxylic acid hydrolase n=1 Tax=Clostridium estertheticum TaxID=238834 RepID=A0A7Y3WRM7_9CLOT|nr:L-2-amino-thiazoline-4-carboxylic acid hydrolase [Clostridium estertheticum]NNU75133.1 L-2-amino-thiazoline-4-carboxylic acid hydrolase [Clostridium estertheticum]WBL48394.1 L-2-amino-thiazoline-4-carboxylic acid hydrolase [Clostridium estertheticum]
MGKVEIVHCRIEHHAVLVALFAKYTIECFGEKGKEAIYVGIENYGHERGKRMAKRAIANGDALDFINSQAYSEWVPEKNTMEFAILKTEPELVSAVTKCEWCASWKKYNLLDYGKYYCINIDDAVFNGFNKNFHMKATSNLSFGADHCEFHWKNPMHEEDTIKLTQKRIELGSTCTRDFNFHTAHLLYSMSKTLKNKLGEGGILIINQVVEEYILLFGKEYFEILKNLQIKQEE